MGTTLDRRTVLTHPLILVRRTVLIHPVDTGTNLRSKRLTGLTLYWLTVRWNDATDLTVRTATTGEGGVVVVDRGNAVRGNDTVAGTDPGDGTF